MNLDELGIAAPLEGPCGVIAGGLILRLLEPLRGVVGVAGGDDDRIAFRTIGDALTTRLDHTDHVAAADVRQCDSRTNSPGPDQRVVIVDANRLVPHEHVIRPWIWSRHFPIGQNVRSAERMHYDRLHFDPPPLYRAPAQCHTPGTHLVA